MDRATFSKAPSTKSKERRLTESYTDQDLYNLPPGVAERGLRVQLAGGLEFATMMRKMNKIDPGYRD